jgi:two-component system chemotaxis response regulator CheB
MDEAASRRDIIVIGASAGGVPVLLELARRLPRDLPASVLIVVHIGAHESTLPELMSAAGPLTAVHPRSGDPLVRGRIYVAPPDHHLLVVGNHVRLTRDAKENHARPAIDPLFRSAAIAHGTRTIGVVLSGRLDDGTAGLQAIQACGGLTVVQDPEDAEERAMPASAMDNVRVDHVVTCETLADTLAMLARQPAGADVRVPQRVACEQQLSQGEGDTMENLDAIGTPSKIVCPECNGVLWEVRDAMPRRFRCHTGHAFTAASLVYTQRTKLDEALWNALRALEERVALLRSLAGTHRQAGNTREGDRLEREAAHLAQHTLQLQHMVSGT